MRSLSKQLGDPSLHLLAIALIMAYLALGRGNVSRDLSGEAPLARCEKCRAHFLPGRNCSCPPGGGIAQAMP